MRNTLSLLAGLALSAAALPALAGEITVYSALEEDEIAAYLERAAQDMPEVKINLLRLSTGDLGARLIAESGNPQADVVWGFAVTNMLNPAIYDQLEPYKAKGEDALAEPFRDKEGRWFAPTGYVGAFCVNTERLAQLGAPVPTSWADLKNPAYKGEVVMPDPSSSGTGYLQIAAILQGAGDEAGWQMIKDIDPNMAQYTTSGSRPCRMAQAGEFAIGASLSYVAMQAIDEGYPVKMVIPSDYAGYELEANGLMKTTKNPDDAKRFLDWTLSPGAAEAYAARKDLVTIPGVPRSPQAEKAGLPQDFSAVLFPMNFAASGEARDAIIAKWRESVGR
ncbi:ABC transporter substrate-binding protein [Paracoccus sp. (in: a-proteobacteria)]|uniref:ABC transporter substrate-binding protein n=1 Tax=Paracoccus sp. TaxID=267 RepID=UPI00289B68DE|nr:ABC transporter substrate-binding protein [Paracoccus sp. (in: a-proteobacteria)]